MPERLYNYLTENFSDHLRKEQGWLRLYPAIPLFLITGPHEYTVKELMELTNDHPDEVEEKVLERSNPLHEVVCYEYNVWFQPFFRQIFITRYMGCFLLGVHTEEMEPSWNIDAVLPSLYYLAEYVQLCEKPHEDFLQYKNFFPEYLSESDIVPSHNESSSY